MFTRIFDWLDDRTNYRRILIPIRRRVLPGGPRWSYALAHCLLWLFVIQVVTGFFLMSVYSPSTTSAWASIHYLEQSPFGSVLRGLHYFASQAMIVLFAVHVIRVLLTAAFRAPRELIWISGLLLIPLTIVWAITGNPLSSSLRGMSQIEVEGNILESTPVLGPLVKRLLLGGDEVGHLTLTHLYFLHVGLMPLLVTLLLGLHIQQIYRHGLTPPARSKPNISPRPYWPYQTVRNMTALAALLSGLVFLAIRYGAPFDAPADSSLTYVPRPEWYFRWLFELRAYFTGDWEFVATMVVPLATLLLLLVVPAFDRWCRPRVSFVFRIILVFLGVGMMGGLTFVSFARDWNDKEYLASERQSAEWARRAREVADRAGVPPEGAVVLLRHDPKTQGPKLFERHCAGCHSHTDSQGVGIAAREPSAPNLYGLASAEWIGGFLDPEKINSIHYFGKTKLADGEMATAIAEKFADASDGSESAALRDNLQKVARALSAEAALPAQAESDRKDAEVVAAGRELLVGDLACTDCHRFHDEGELGSAPDLTGYASRDWLRKIISNPQHERFYPEDRNDRMPAFAADATRPQANLLQPEEIDLLVDWLRHDWYESTPTSPDAVAAGRQIAQGPR